MSHTIAPGNAAPSAPPAQPKLSDLRLAFSHGFRVSADEAAVAAARREVPDVARGWGVPLTDETFSDLGLLSSEVITNAIRHTNAPCAVVVRWTGVRVRVEVTDVSPARPHRRHGSLDAEGGRGLLLVESLATAWGSAPDPAGKTVWFELGPSDGTPPPWSTPGKWTITTDSGSATSGYLPAWAEDDPTEANVPLDQLPERLAAVNHRNFFEGPMLPLTAPDVWAGAEEDAVFEGSIDCNPYDPDPRLRAPLVNLQVCVGRWITGLDPHGLADVAAKLRAHADFLDEKVRPALIAAREDWIAHQPDEPPTYPWRSS
ncbi:ATP-binding protein [Actinacidiphila bryophytorum]|uniref:ATP-binding protein n=1 Tax=Actinacidiphila bryophytorum TaxID=1436133 RepID=UPI002176B04F|nr:ATP-binding protein [Actinacidiphila bryophytorum]UWE07682.1 ATP-binding protein [Actinacidiphila bryophytorum]